VEVRLVHVNAMKQRLQNTDDDLAAHFSIALMCAYWCIVRVLKNYLEVNWVRPLNLLPRECCALGQSH
jgi:hypothetical protein